mgnify:FL=1
MSLGESIKLGLKEDIVDRHIRVDEGESGCVERVLERRADNLLRTASVSSN